MLQTSADTDDDPLPTAEAKASVDDGADAEVEALAADGEDDADTTAGEPTAADQEPGDGDIVITLGDDPVPDSVEETPVIRTIRQRNRDLVAALRRTEAERDAARGTSVPAAAIVGDPGPVPKIADFDFDDDKHAQAVTDWTARKAAADASKADRERVQHAQHQAWLSRISGYEVAKKALKVPNFAEAEDNVLQSLSLAQQGLLLKAKDAEKLVYALGNSPKRLQALAAIADPVDFVYAAAELRQEIKVQPRKKPPAPERVPGGGAATGAGHAIATTRRLEELKKEADRTRDYSAYFAEKRRTQGRRVA